MDKQAKQQEPADKAQPEPQAPVEATVPLSAVNDIVVKAVAAAMAKNIHQHTPIGQAVQTELSGRTREEGTLVVSKLDDTKGYTEWGFNDGTVRRDYK